MSIINRIIIASAIIKNNKKKRFIKLSRLFIKVISNNNINKAS